MNHSVRDKSKFWELLLTGKNDKYTLKILQHNDS